MNTYAIQLELHFQSSRDDDNRFEAFVAEVKAAAARHGIAFGGFQSMQLPGGDYTLSACSSCGHLTVDRACLSGSIERMLPDFWFNVRRGSFVAQVLTCDLCKLSGHAA